VFDLAKNALGGATLLVMGWMLPTYIALQIAAALIFPELSSIPMINHFEHGAATSSQLQLIGAAVVLGLTLAAIQAPLYRVLEGYLLLPSKLYERQVARHQLRRRELVAKHEETRNTERGVHAAVWYERAARYPVQDRQFAPTALGNAIRRFETYGGDRYQLDSQLLWHHFIAVAPDSAVRAVSSARANVDFFVCLLYTSCADALFGAIVASTGYGDLRIWIAIGLGIAIPIICYRLAILATDEWDAAVRALVDHGRVGVAAAFGFHIPVSFESERLMWRTINTLVRRPYAYSESKNVAALVTEFRKLSTEQSSAISKSAGAGTP
jgi:hypothetical protein